MYIYIYQIEYIRILYTLIVYIYISNRIYTYIIYTYCVYIYISNRIYTYIIYTYCVYIYISIGQVWGTLWLQNPDQPPDLVSGFKLMRLSWAVDVFPPNKMVPQNHAWILSWYGPNVLFIKMFQSAPGVTPSRVSKKRLFSTESSGLPPSHLA